MKKSLIAFCSICLVMMACSEQKRNRFDVTVGPSDSMAAIAADSALAATETVEMPEGADELFDDFFFNFVSNQRQQRERVVFPLTVKDGDNERTIQQKQWKLEPFFMKQDYYTLFFDSQAQMELVRDTTVANVVVERFYLEKERVEQFFFSRKSGRWMLHEIEWQPMMQNANAQFMQFYRKFASDSLFQHKSLASQIDFSGPDPEDDFSTMEGVITPDFWDAFRPDLPNDVIYNIVYGRQNPASMQKIMLLRGIANGLEVEITFRLQKGHWKLTRLSM